MTLDLLICFPRGSGCAGESKIQAALYETARSLSTKNYGDLFSCSFQLPKERGSPRDKTDL
jgi:hypothetical protein